MHSFVLLFLFEVLGTLYGIRINSITVPKEVIFKGNATFRCNYNMERDRLYSLKWYKRINERDTEFFSYISTSEQSTHHPERAPGFQLDQQRSSNTGDVLYLFDIDTASEGYYKCEVSADHTFQTVKMGSYMTVIVPPTKPPIIHGYKTFYSIGEVVSSFCDPSYSKPKSQIKWFINGDEAPNDYLITTGNDSNSGISFTLEKRHLISGRLRLCCTAFIDSDFKLQVSSEETLIKGKNQLQSVPIIIGLKSNYTLDQYLDVNCTLPQITLSDKSEPKLQWFIHNQKPNRDFVKRYDIKNTIGLRFRIKSYHLDNNSSLFIKCTATEILKPHKHTSALRLTNPQKNQCISHLINANLLYLLLILVSMKSNY